MALHSANKGYQHSSTKAKRKPPRSRKQGSIDSLGVLSEFYGKNVSSTPSKVSSASTSPTATKLSTKYSGDISDVNALLLVGRSFQYVTRKGERKNYVIRSYLPWNGSHRVQRLTDNFDDPEDEKTHSRRYKTKLIDLAVLPNIRWLDDAIDHADMDENIDSSSRSSSSNEDGNPERKKSSGDWDSRSKRASLATRGDRSQTPIDGRKRKREDPRSVSPLPKKLPKVTREDDDEEEEVSPTNSPTRTVFQGIDEKDSSLKNSSIPVSIQPDPSPLRKQNRKKPKPKEAHASTKQSDEEHPSSSFGKRSKAAVWEEPPKTEKSDTINYRTKKSYMSIYNGVWNKRTSTTPWIAQFGRKKFIKMNGSKTIGQYDTEVEAAKAYDRAVRKHYPGELLNKLNFPTNAERLQLAKIEEANAKGEEANQPETNLPMNSTPTKVSKSTRDAPSAKTTKSLAKTTKSVPASENRTPAVGDLIASRVGGESGGFHFGTLVECEDNGTYDNTSTNKVWTVSFDIGKTEKIHENDVTDGMELYETLFQNEDAFPIPKKGGPKVGDRTAFDFGSSGIQFGSIKGIVEDSDDSDNDGEEPEKAWMVAFDDGDDIELDFTEIQKGLELYREIRRKRSIKSLVNSSQRTSNLSAKQQSPDMDVAKSTAEGATISTRRLLKMKPGDRIAHDFGDAGVYFGSVEKANGTESWKKEDWSWDIAFDDGDRYMFDTTEMSQAIALYDEIREKERTDPNTQEKIREYKEEHLAEKKAILDELPQRVTDRFLRCGFAKWGKSHLPCLFLGPYDVSPGNVREEWLEAFSKVTKNSRKTPQIVFWFGSKNMDKGYSILEDSDCLSLKEARALGLMKHRTTQSNASLRHNHALFKLREAMTKPRDHSRLPLPVHEAHERIASGDRLLAEFEATKEIGTTIDE